MISIIIPIYNAAAKGLEVCLQRVACQTYGDFEAILVDDGSTDESGAICDAWGEKDPRFLVIHQHNQGPAAARNAALKIVRGEEIAFVDSDDLPDTNLLEVLHGSMQRLHADMAMARFGDVNDGQMKLTEGCLSGRTMLLGLFGYYTPLYKNLFAKLYKRELLEDIRFENLRTAEDVDFQSRVYPRVKRCAFVDQSLYIYNRSEDSIMHTQSSRDYLDILQCYEGMAERLSGEDETMYGRALDALMRKVVSLRYRNRMFADQTLDARLLALEKRFLPEYWHCKNGNLLVKMGLLTCLKMPGLHALVMNYRER